jgi:hypothetical protein
VTSSAVRSLEHLVFDASISDGDAAALASASFERLHTLTVSVGSLDSKQSAALTWATWFRKLRSLKITLEGSQDRNLLRNLSQMPLLESLTVYDPTDEQTQALDESCEFPALRHLKFLRPKLAGDQMRAFVKAKMPQLLELSMHQCNSRTKDLEILIESELCANLQILDLYLTGQKALNALAQGRFAKNLRMLKVGFGEHGSVTSLVNSPLTDPKAFPSLTTLEITHPFAEDGDADTGAFLRNLATPRLRHLKLEKCRFDDESANAIGTSPVFSNLTRLAIEHDFGKPSLLHPPALVEMLKSRNLQNVVELIIQYYPIGDALSVLLDSSVLPNLRSGLCFGSGSRGELIQQLKALRPGFLVSDL